MLAEIGRVLLDLSGVGAPAGQQRSPTRVAEGVPAIGAIKAHPSRSEAVDIGRLDERMSVATERIVQVVGHDQEHISGCRGLGGSHGARAPGNAEANQHQRREQPAPKRATGGHLIPLLVAGFSRPGSRMTGGAGRSARPALDVLRGCGLARRRFLDLDRVRALEPDTVQDLPDLREIDAAAVAHRREVPIF